MSKTKHSSNKHKQTLALTVSRSKRARVQDYSNPPEVQRTRKISITADTGLLAFVDEYMKRHPGTTCSGVIDQALELWVSHMQRENDLTCYQSADLSSAQKQADADWSAVTKQAAKHIWS